MPNNAALSAGKNAYPHLRSAREIRCTPQRSEVNFSPSALGFPRNCFFPARLRVALEFCACRRQRQIRGVSPHTRGSNQPSLVLSRARQEVARAASVVAVPNILFREPSCSVFRKHTNCCSFRAFCRKYPEDRINCASLFTGVPAIPAAVSNSALRNARIARSTLVQFVFCVRIAPTIISNRVLPGHHFCGPSASNKAWKYSRKTGIALIPAVPCLSLSPVGSGESAPSGIRENVVCGHLFCTIVIPARQVKNSPLSALPIACPTVQVLANSQLCLKNGLRRTAAFAMLTMGMNDPGSPADVCPFR